LFSAPATSTDRFTDQLADVVIATLDKFAPLETITLKADGKPVNRFLSQNAKEAKTKCRLLERSATLSISAVSQAVSFAASAAAATEPDDTCDQQRQPVGAFSVNFLSTTRQI